MKNAFKDILKGKVVILGIGNTLRGDDGFGPVLIEKLRGEVKAVCIDAGSSPESYIGKIADENPDTILIVDAIYLDLAPGEYEILNKSDIAKSGFTTHDISPRMLIEYLESQTRADIYMLGIQPEKLSFGDEISDHVKQTLQDVRNLIKEACPAIPKKSE